MSQSKDFGKDEDDLMVALDKCLLKIYKADASDLQPLVGRLDPPAITEELIPALSVDVDLQTVDVDVVSTPAASSEESNFDLTTSDDNFLKVWLSQRPWDLVQLVERCRNRDLKDCKVITAFELAVTHYFSRSAPAVI